VPKEVGQVTEERERGRPWEAAAAYGRGLRMSCGGDFWRVLGAVAEDWIARLRWVGAERFVEGMVDLMKGALAASLHASEEAGVLFRFEARRFLCVPSGAEKRGWSLQACDARRSCVESHS
jgi:hypothetical protein